MAKIIMIYGKDCLDSIAMMPLVRGLNMGGKHTFTFFEASDLSLEKIKEKYKKALKKTKKEDATPMFINEEDEEAFFAPNIEKLMGWLEGPTWWKNY